MTGASVRPSAGCVKKYGAEIAADFARLHREIPDYRTRDLFARFLGYLAGAFRSGARYLWQRDLLRSFAASSRRRGRMGYSLTHVEDAFPAFKRWCRSFRFTMEHIGRSWRAKVEPAFAGERGGAEIAARLCGAVRATVAARGRCHCGAEFLRKFAALTKLPAAAVVAAWDRIRAIDGLRVRWRGVGNGRKFVASPEPKNTRRDAAQICGISPPPTSGVFSGLKTEENKQAPRGDASRQDSPLAPLAPGRVGEGSAPGCARPASVAPGSARAGEGRPDAEGTPGRADDATQAHAAESAQPSTDRPFHVCNRWIAPRKLRGFARWLAFGPLQTLHREFPLVVFRPGHALKFATEAAAFGFSRDEIVAAWRAGVARSHDDALDRDRLPGGGYAAAREPSAAKVYAVRELARDRRTWRERWAALLAAGARCIRPADAAPGVHFQGRGSEAASRVAEPAAGSGAAAGVQNRGPAAGAASRVAPVARFTAAEAAERLAQLRARVRSIEAEAAQRRGEAAEPAPGVADVAAWCRAHGMTVAQFAALPWRDRQAILQRVRERTRKE